MSYQNSQAYTSAPIPSGPLSPATPYNIESVRKARLEKAKTRRLAWTVVILLFLLGSLAGLGYFAKQYADVKSLSGAFDNLLSEFENYYMVRMVIFIVATVIYLLILVAVLVHYNRKIKWILDPLTPAHDIVSGEKTVSK
ncbi:hypothetical protein GGI12_000459 [Dipsacomyces acuminosporus]|nr:hypothetical protein GGI12_000459 [Dipsacomyces acuminosporus]